MTIDTLTVTTKTTPRTLLFKYSHTGQSNFYFAPFLFIPYNRIILLNTILLHGLTLLPFFRYDPPGTILPPACSKSQPKPMKRCSFSHSRDEDDLDDHNKNAVQAILKKSRNHIISALLKAKSPDMSDDSAGDRDRKGNGAKSDGKESKRNSIMSLQSNSTDISRVCSKEAYEDWLVSDELLDILSDPNTCSPLHSRRPSNESQGTWNLFIANNVKNEPSVFSSDTVLHAGEYHLSPMTYSILLYPILLYPILLRPTPPYSILFYYTPQYPGTLPCPVLPCPV